MKRFDSDIDESLSRKISLLVYNCSAHGAIKTISALNNVEVLLLLPNTTSKVQLMYSYVIDSSKTRY